jgi:hypothetical protein
LRRRGVGSGLTFRHGLCIALSRSFFKTPQLLGELQFKDYLMRQLARLLLVALNFSLLSAANAGTVVCEGTVQELTLHQPGLVGLRLSSMSAPIFICRIDAEQSVPGAAPTSAANCKAMYASLLAAKLSGTVVHSAYFDGDQVPASCNTAQPWTYVSLRYFTL